MDQLFSRLHTSGPSITLLVGENGSGKSHKLANLAQVALAGDLGVLALANAVYKIEQQRS